MALYAAYGTNLDPTLMALIAPHSPQRGAGWLMNWRLTFGGEEHGGEGAQATAVEDAGHQVFVALYELTPADESALDGWEGAAPGVHKKVRVRIATLDGDELAWIYVIDGYEGGLPSARLVAHLADAAERAGAPDDYARWLRERPCRSVGP